MISTLPRGIGSVLDAPDLDPFWKAADDTGAVIHIHPAFDAGESRVHDYGLANGVGRVSDALVAVSRLAMSGHITRYQNAKIFVPIGAAGLPFVVGRLKRNHAITPGTSDPAEALSLMYTDTIEHDPRVLRFVIEMMGADRVMLGSDMPFPIGDHEPMKIVDGGRPQAGPGRSHQRRDWRRSCSASTDKNQGRIAMTIRIRPAVRRSRLPQRRSRSALSADARAQAPKSSPS